MPSPVMSHPLRLQRAKLLLLESDTEFCAVLQSHVIPLRVEAQVASSALEAQNLIDSGPILATIVGPGFPAVDLMKLYFDSPTQDRLWEAPLICLGKDPTSAWGRQPKKHLFLPAPIEGRVLCHHLNVLCHLQEEVRVLKKELEELYHVQEDLNDFVSVVAHDIRSPLTLVMGYADLIFNQSGLSDDVQQYIDTIKNASEVMTSLLTSLEFYASLREEEITEAIVPMSNLMEEILSELTQELNLPKLKVSLSVEHSIEGDKSMLKSMFKEILKNALLYCRNDSPTLTITSKELGERRETLVPLDRPLILFEVRDEGIGFAPKNKEIIFQPLKRLVSGTIPGHGLGLAVARRVCLRHGGTLTARSVEGQGSCFYATFPRFQKDRLL